MVHVASRQLERGRPPPIPIVDPSSASTLAQPWNRRLVAANCLSSTVEGAGLMVVFGIDDTAAPRAVQQLQQPPLTRRIAQRPSAEQMDGLSLPLVQLGHEGGLHADQPLSHLQLLGIVTVAEGDLMQQPLTPEDVPCRVVEQHIRHGIVALYKRQLQRAASVRIRAASEECPRHAGHVWFLLVILDGQHHQRHVLRLLPAEARAHSRSSWYRPPG
mmetsp:Transcript_39108/g.111760  ORF Transcript_39108/g.111760 Transcript_39108/m.111760 type:complete len:216 (-) Transcript_39108:45-692(-)